MKKGIGILAFLICLAIQLPAQSKVSPSLNTPLQAALIDSITQALTNYYVFPDKAAAINKYLNKQFKSHHYDSLISPAAFTDAIMKDIRSIINDKHLIIRYDPDLQQKIIHFNATTQKDPADFDKALRQNFFFNKVEILPSNIGYIHFTNFSDTSATARETVRAAMQFVAHTDALILDLRNNYGGNGTMAGEICSYFFKEKTFTGRSYNRINNTWVDMWVENQPAVTGGLAMNMPLYILTSKRTFSAAEGLAYILQHVRKAVVTGEPTRGGAHLTRSFSVGNGFVAFIPFFRTENAVTHTDWEGSGILPDLPAKESDGIQAAHKAILSKKLLATTNDTEKRKISWLINAYNARPALSDSTKTGWQIFTGQFEEFAFSIQENRLICTNLHNNNRTDTLLSITPTLFQINNEVQVEFILDEKNTCHSIRLYWKDGWLDTISRTH